MLPLTNKNYVVSLPNHFLGTYFLYILGSNLLPFWTRFHKTISIELKDLR